ncbi:hypothetical protein TU94_01885 [Streptomyces cyaneogriseus subsp. noncyanogenus]|uniref:Uncharacterized protein n=1 Tax=Streptomyces cyaneogriseus subsp. noncyanogenus TaxID=477245 RepID=A0A0C5FVJ7_9ACTN|nr:hypothetical protein TU94_01885 [Streptomyces cyaneogriseus subsp. noncyanogenus]
MARTAVRRRPPAPYRRPAPALRPSPPRPARARPGRRARARGQPSPACRPGVRTSSSTLSTVS